MRSSIFYRSAVLYDLLMLVLYGRAFSRRLACVAALVPEHSSVLEVCCGPGRLFARLRGKATSYRGLDKSPAFATAARRRGADVQVGDVREAKWPAGAFDVVVMQASLYQFHPECERLLDALLRVARRQVVICEPVVNLASARNPLLRTLARRLTHAGGHEGEFRFDAASLAAFMQRYRDRLIATGTIDGGREMYYVLRAEEST